ncbi:MAG: retroviral-like aspartic protease family protein [Candidatus Obscuribacterales bacterium]
MARLWSITLLTAGFLSLSAPAIGADQLSEGITLYKAGKLPDAVKSLSAFISSHQNSPQDSTAYYYLACCYYQSGQTAEAKRLYETIASAYPKSEEARTAQQMLARLQAPGSVFPLAVGSAVPAKAAPAPSTAVSSDDNSGDTAEERRYEAEYAALPQSTRVVFKRDEGGHMYVTVWLNNRPIKAIFDTGAHAHFGLNHLSQVGISVPADAKTSNAYGWAGRPVPIWLMDASLKLGDMTRRVPITVEENMALAPLVGQEFLKELRYEIDDKGGVMTLSKTRTRAANQYNSMYDVPCMQVDGDDMITLEVEGKKTVAIIDTGAQVTILSPATLAQLGIEIDSNAPRVSIGGVGGSTTCRVMELDLQVGPVRRQNFRTLIGGAAGNAIGQDFMQGWRYTVDHDRHLLRFFH